MNHYDVRSIYTEEIGRALAKRFDQNIAQLIHLASDASAKAPGKASTSTGSVAVASTTSTTTGIASDGANIAKAIYDAVVVLDRNDVPDDGQRYCVLSAGNYARLVQYAGGPDKPTALGSFAKNSVMEIAGVKVLKSNNLPKGTISAVTGANNVYNGTFTTGSGVDHLGLVFHKNAVGTLKLLDLAVESEYRIDLQGTLIVSKYAMGHGILRPECSVRLVPSSS
jgi:hypothetical protein